MLNKLHPRFVSIVSQERRVKMRGSDIRLLIYCPHSLRMGAGGARWLSAVAPRLQSRGIEPSILGTDFIASEYRGKFQTWHIDSLRDSGIYYREVKTSRFFQNINQPVLTLRSVGELSRYTINHDLVYFMNAYALQDVTVLFAKRVARDTPIISGQHATLFQDWRLHNAYVHAVAKHVLHGFDAYHVLNMEDLEIYRKWGLKRVFAIPSGVDVERFRPPLRKESNKFTVLFVGRLDFQKGIDIFLEAIHKLHESQSSIAHRTIFNVSGKGPLKEKVEEFSVRYSTLNYLGYVDEIELLRLYQSADIFVIPSRRETFGLVGLEAMASGLPIIASNVGGLKTYVTDDFGRLIPPSDSDTLADAIESFYQVWLDDQNRFRNMGVAARTACVTGYDWNLVADRLARMIRFVNSNSGRRE